MRVVCFPSLVVFKVQKDLKRKKERRRKKNFSKSWCKTFHLVGRVQESNLMTENFKSMTLKLIKNSRYELVVFSDKCTTGRWGNIHKQIYVGNSPKRPRQHWAERNFHVFHIKYLQVTT